MFNQEKGTLLMRSAMVTLHGKKVTLLGPALKVGDRAPVFTALKNDLSRTSLTNFLGTPLIISSVPSLDTPICDIQTKRFVTDVAKRPGVNLVTISMDLPFAQARWCGASNLGQSVILSDHMDAEFGMRYGVLIDDMRLLARAVFVVDAEGILKHVQIVPEISDEPDYDAVWAAL